MDLSSFAQEFQRRFDTKVAAREQALAASRRAIRASANAIRAIHRGDLDEAHRLMDDARDVLRAGRAAALPDHPDVYHAGYLLDAQKEYTEARLTEALITGSALPDPDALEVELHPYLNGMAETIGEGRRAILDLLRRGDASSGERILAGMEDLYGLLVSMDYPDAITGNLRRSTDIARSILEKTRGDLTLSLVQGDLKEALARHADRLGPDAP